MLIDENGKILANIAQQTVYCSSIAQWNSFLDMFPDVTPEEGESQYEAKRRVYEKYYVPIQKWMPFIVPVQSNQKIAVTNPAAPAKATMTAVDASQVPDYLKTTERTFLFEDDDLNGDIGIATITPPYSLSESYYWPTEYLGMTEFTRSTGMEKVESGYYQSIHRTPGGGIVVYITRTITLSAQYHTDSITVPFSGFKLRPGIAASAAPVKGGAIVTMYSLRDNWATACCCPAIESISTTSITLNAASMKGTGSVTIGLLIFGEEDFS